ncbi:MAG TPA: hypothetical protein VFX59_14010 [Polyangiales bacterium]|nr:hypothetical protein [Polyangiales bacterium]
MEQAVPVAKPKLLALGAVVVLLGLVLRVSWVTEDAYITLRTVDNWVNGFGLRWNVDERVQSYTHPLWMLLLATGYAITREAFFTTVLLGVLTTGAAAYTLVHYARTAGHAVVAIVLLTLSQGFIDFSTSGLENPLSHLLIALFVGLYAARATPLWQLALTVSLLACTRIDALLVVGPALVHASWLELRAVGARSTARSLAIGFAPFLAWELFSVFYYGFPFPNTAYAKLNTGLPRLDVVRQGLVYWLDGLAWDLPLHTVALAGVATALLQRRPRELLIALGLLLYTLYVINIGGDFMHGRFWTIPFFTGVCLIAISELPLEDPVRAAAVVLPFALFMLHPLAKEALTREFTYNGIADERLVFRDHMSSVLNVRVNPVPNHEWAGLGRELQRRGEKIVVNENVGLLGFHAGPGLHIIDPLALTDPLLARLPMRQDHGWRVGHYVRQIPSGYPETVASVDGTCLMKDKRMCTYYGLLHEVIAGPLFSFSRLKAVVLLNLGLRDSLLDRDRYRDPKTSHATLEDLSEPVREHALWDATGTFQIPARGVTIELPKPSHAVRLELSVDGNDDYRLEFRSGTKALAKVDTPAEARGAMRTRKVQVPDAARSAGFDYIYVRPSGGDGMYSIGYLRLYDR